MTSDLLPMLSAVAPCHPAAALRDLVLVQRGQAATWRLDDEDLDDEDEDDDLDDDEEDDDEDEDDDEEEEETWQV